MEKHLNSTTSKAPQTALQMSKAATNFIETLSPEQAKIAIFPFAGNERYIWNYTPVPRNGLLLKDMSDEQKVAAFELMSTGLSDRGMQTALKIIDLENPLRESEKMSGGLSKWTRDPELYWFSIFGDPKNRAPWGWRIGGHHVCLHFTLLEHNLVTSNPLFFGANPAQIQHGPDKGKRTLIFEEDVARALVCTLGTEQQLKAIVDPLAPDDILTKNYRNATPEVVPVGLTFVDMETDARELLVKLIKHYIERTTSDLATNEWNRIESAGLETIAFAWAGPLEPGHGHYYAIKNENFLIEYDNTQDNANHIHSVFRGYKTDFGEDLLAAHYEQSKHK